MSVACVIHAMCKVSIYRTRERFGYFPSFVAFVSFFWVLLHSRVHLCIKLARKKLYNHGQSLRSWKVYHLFLCSMVIFSMPKACLNPQLYDILCEKLLVM